MSVHNSPQSTLQRRSYHIRRESTILKTNNKSVATRKRSNTDIDSRHYKKSNQKKINRRFDSIHNKFDENKVEISYESIHSNQNNNENNILNEILKQFRDIVLPLQTEIKSLKQITIELQNQVNILKEENNFYRKHRPKSVYIDYESNTNNYCNDFTYIPNLPCSHGITPFHSTAMTPNIIQQSTAITPSINPVYLFNPPSKTTVSDGTRNNYENEIHTETKIKVEMEEDDLELNNESNIKCIDKHIENDMSYVTQIYLELSENDHITTPENKYYSTKSIEKTYDQTRNSMKSMSNEYDIDNYNSNNKSKMNDMFI